jgi:hypothetical protein
MLKINKTTKEVIDIPVNLFLEKEKSYARIHFNGEYVFADESYLKLP